MFHITGNKGEWSELYVLLKLISQRKIYAADANVNKIEDIYFPILNIYRDEKDVGKINYDITSPEQVNIYINNKLTTIMSYDTFNKQANYLLSELRLCNNAYKKRAFEIVESEKFMHEINCRRLAATSKDKSDIVMKIHDFNNGFDPVCGFSVKSELGAAPTLLNSSKATNFTYKIIGMNQKKLIQINSIESRNKIKDRMRAIFSEFHVEFDHVSNCNLNVNLMKIDSIMPQIMSEALIYHYRDDISSCKQIVEKLEDQNPINYPSKGFYEYKFKKLLCAIALGMVPSLEWNGIDEATGGYIIVKEDGDVLAFYIYNRNAFEDYLLNNTKFERGSTSKHDYAYIYEKQDNYYINLNLAIRFIK